MSLPSIQLLHHMLSKILPGQDFKSQGHYSNGKVQIKVTPRRYTPTPTRFSNSLSLQQGQR